MVRREALSFAVEFYFYRTFAQLDGEVAANQMYTKGSVIGTNKMLLQSTGTSPQPLP